MEEKVYTNEEAEAIFKKQYKEVLVKAEARNDKEREKKRNYHEKVNSTCPKCGSKNVNDRIKRIQGEGSLSGNMSGSSFLGGGYMSGSLRGSSSFDTNEVNKCNECDHEWKKHERKYSSVKDVINEEVGSMIYKFNVLHDNSDFIYDPNDWGCEYNSQEEAAKAFEEKIAKSFKYYESNLMYGLYPEVIEKLTEDYGDSWDKERFENITERDFRTYGHPIIDYPSSPFRTVEKLGFIKYIKSLFRR